ncbi:hypothetical protein OW763_07340 [Clostridium aestuarii]|uniref:Uncharacterized protein n=1 Tax=Clostridium aestuarii TaxID=338193 RepID=A0ABT4CZB5_9CLOT|nr:hypothetical protein [Clostridium aestuarii]MCY6484167.1 hypothetical protein [Clostridium aestuarii]
MKKNYKMKKTISVKRFISDLGEEFSENMKKRLLELEVRCVLTRKEDKCKLDLKHVEHTQYEDGSKAPKEYVYGQFIVNEGILYFSDRCTESDKVMQSPIVSDIYASLNNEDMISDEECNAKKIDDSNIDYVIDTILTVCPEVSQKYLDIVKEMTSYPTK